MFRQKTMEQAQWTSLQNKVEMWLVAAADSGVAVFREAGSLVGSWNILVAANDPAPIEAMSQGGWTDCDDARARKWQLLAGDAGAAERYGLTLGL